MCARNVLIGNVFAIDEAHIMLHRIHGGDGQMYLTIRIDHEFTDPAAFAVFANGYAELCKAVGITPGGNEPVGRAACLPAQVDSAGPPQPTEKPAPSAETVRDVQSPVASPSSVDAPTSQRRRGRPTSAEVAARKAADTGPLAAGPIADPATSAEPLSEPVTDTAPNVAPEPAASESENADLELIKTVTLDSVKAALSKLIMSDDAGEEKANAIKSELFPKTKLSELDADTLAKVYAKLQAALAGAA